MIYAVMTSIELDNPSKQDKMLQAIQDKIANKILWTNQFNPTQVSKGQSEEGRLVVNSIMRFNTEAEALEVARYIKDRITKIPALSGSVRLHKCYHDEGGKPCEPEKEI